MAYYKTRTDIAPDMILPGKLTLAFKVAYKRDLIFTHERKAMVEDLKKLKKSFRHSFFVILNTGTNLFDYVDEILLEIGDISTIYCKVFFGAYAQYIFFLQFYSS